MLQAGWIIRDLNDPDDRLALHDFYDRAQDYIILETGLVPSDDTIDELFQNAPPCLLYTSPSPRDLSTSRMPSSA